MSWRNGTTPPVPSARGIPVADAVTAFTSSRPRCSAAHTAYGPREQHHDRGGEPDVDQHLAARAAVDRDERHRGRGEARQSRRPGQRAERDHDRAHEVVAAHRSELRILERAHHHPERGRADRRGGGFIGEVRRGEQELRVERQQRRGEQRDPRVARESPHRGEGEDHGEQPEHEARAAEHAQRLEAAVGGEDARTLWVDGERGTAARRLRNRVEGEHRACERARGGLHVDPGVAEQRRRQHVHERRLHALAGHLERVAARQPALVVDEGRVVDVGRLAGRLEERYGVAIGEGEPDIDGQQERRGHGDRLGTARIDDLRQALREVALLFLPLVHGGPQSTRDRGPRRGKNRPVQGSSLASARCAHLPMVFARLHSLLETLPIVFARRRLARKLAERLPGRTRSPILASASPSAAFPECA
jgi:hypothetical protein